MTHRIIHQGEIQKFIKILNKKIQLCTSDHAKQKYIKQKELLEDSIVIYELNHECI